MTVIVIGSSAGGPQALHDLLPLLKPGLAAPLIIVSHVGENMGDLLTEGLARTCTLPVRIAAERMPVEPGVVHVAPSGYHLLIEPDRRFAYSVDERIRFSRPSIDVLFVSAAEVYRDELVGVVLSGANADGAEGLRTIRRLGGLALVQDPNEAIVPTMPLAAIEQAGADICAPTAILAAHINSYVRP
ncbi:chemotaxis protein CheB [Aquabacter cavernae]|uniref:chemotaxis protein CheB n=1 Tax=Aquabacter cavernae TaxID=2496029 RepID=UPI000F8E7E95|nr:chemotaxis protein CheB [Aquabacter cavernae]